VLLVEDDFDIMLVFKKALEKYGYIVRAFSNPYDAFEHFKANVSLYDLLLAEMKMENVSGFELARLAKELNPKMKLLFTTAYEVTKGQIESELIPLLYPANTEKARITKKGFPLIIPKPAKLEKILASVKRVLSEYSSLKDPSDYEHIVILYTDKNGDQSNYYDIISEYFNAGLAKNQLCIYTYIENDVKTVMTELSKRIMNYEENIKIENLLMVDFKTYCSSALDNNLKPFEEFMQVIKEKASEMADKHVRIIGRAAGWLYENKHFDQCFALEQWWHTKPFVGSLVCPYKMSLFNHKQFFEHQDSVLVRHDTILEI
jgi:CheY-like chemotaxis protein